MYEVTNLEACNINPSLQVLVEYAKDILPWAEAPTAFVLYLLSFQEYSWSKQSRQAEIEPPSSVKKRLVHIEDKKGNTSFWGKDWVSLKPLYKTWVSWDWASATCCGADLRHAPYSPENLDGSRSHASVRLMLPEVLWGTEVFVSDPGTHVFCQHLWNCGRLLSFKWSKIANPTVLTVS